MGIQAKYYRENEHIPTMGDGGLAEFDEDGQRRRRACKVREQTHIESGRIGLLERYPERAIFYPWVDEEHRRQAEQRGRIVLQQLRKNNASRERKRRALRQRSTKIRLRT